MTNASNAPGAPGAPGEAIRCEQGAATDLAGRNVGVMNIYEDGGLVAQVSIYDPATSKDEDVVLRANAEVTIGDRRFRVAEIVQAKAGARGAVLLVPVEGTP